MQEVPGSSPGISTIESPPDGWFFNGGYFFAFLKHGKLKVNLI